MDTKNKTFLGSVSSCNNKIIIYSRESRKVFICTTSVLIMDFTNKKPKNNLITYQPKTRYNTIFHVAATVTARLDPFPCGLFALAA